MNIKKTTDLLHDLRAWLVGTVETAKIHKTELTHIDEVHEALEYVDKLLELLEIRGMNKMNMLRLEEQATNLYRVYYDTEEMRGVYIGTIYAEVGGFYVFNEEAGGGAWSTELLRLLADKLDELNKPVREELEQLLKDKESK